jgi:hypothetical protein
VTEPKLEWLVAVNLRLAQHIAIPAAGKRGERTLGLGRHLEGQVKGCCLFPSVSPPSVRVDYHGAGGQAVHPEDWHAGCPARYHDPGLVAQIYRAFEIEDLGGLSAYAGCGWGSLPSRVVEFYRAAIGARDRFVAEREAST